MAIVENNLSPGHRTNGTADIERLQGQIRDLQDECSRLKQALAKSEAERIVYHQAFIDQARATRKFEELDIASLQSISAGPLVV